ncbi:hypothetical protein GCK72_000276 [Caenorhabditis remanei]|uniref:Uncharacterized protein n=1 Tax=Caenorhabditis remanei TaxID=31234 RepID=A0A6A5HPE8_CAERE|nr:hypothetical protein GCK72_000276 [Caenorhabditis remanei]KAF1768464.1 hypothetical protein GCK72_000276 [Caenorhabditis remanei]
MQIFTLNPLDPSEAGMEGRASRLESPHRVVDRVFAVLDRFRSRCPGAAENDLLKLSRDNRLHLLCRLPKARPHELSRPSDGSLNDGVFSIPGVGAPPVFVPPRHQQRIGRPLCWLRSPSESPLHLQHHPPTPSVHH